MKAHQEDIKINIKVVWGWQENKIHPSKSLATYTTCQRKPSGSQHGLASLSRRQRQILNVDSLSNSIVVFNMGLMILIIISHRIYNHFYLLFNFMPLFLSAFPFEWLILSWEWEASKHVYRSPQRGHPRQSDEIKQKDIISSSFSDTASAQAKKIAGMSCFRHHPVGHVCATIVWLDSKPSVSHVKSVGNLLLGVLLLRFQLLRTSLFLIMLCLF